MPQPEATGAHAADMGRRRRSDLRRNLLDWLLFGIGSGLAIWGGRRGRGDAL